MGFSVFTIYHRLFRIWRKKRFDLFLHTLEPRPTDVLLDVGGYPWFWARYPQPVARIDAVNLHEVPWSREQAPDHHIRTLAGDGCALGFADRSYDIGFSNSVIEHVGTWENQQRFAAEIRRVSNALWVQTPAYECPIEPHYLAPFVHYLPRGLQKKLIRWCTLRGWIDRFDQQRIDQMVDTTRLLSKREMRELFPDCEILTERMLWILPKSYIAVRKQP